MSLSTGLSALRANQTAMSVVGNNIANASTEGFRREEVLFVENPHVQMGDLSIGTGVSIGDIRRVGNAVLESAIRDGESSGGMLASRLQTARQIESLFLPGPGTLQARTEQLFANLTSLSSRPTDSAIRSMVINSAGELASELNRVWNALESIARSIDTEIEQTIEAIQLRSEEIAQLNLEIAELENSGQKANDLRNQRDLLLRGLAELIEVEEHVRPDGQSNYLLAGGLFSVDEGLDALRLVRNDEGQLEIWKVGCDRPHPIEGGKLGGLLAQNNGPGGIEDTKSKLQEFVGTLAIHLDGAHANGVGIGSAFNTLTGGRFVEDPSAPLSQATLINSVSPGSLFLSVNDEASGTTILHELSFDPATDSLVDVAASVDALDHLSATVTGAGSISIVAEVGYTFDFTGNLQTLPDPANITGTTRPEVMGRYEGEGNAEFRFQFSGTGTIGVTEGLQLEVLDQNNNVLRILDVGRDYEPGSELLAGDGVRVSLSSGTVADGDNFLTELVGRPDETGLLSAIGMNTLFVGSDVNDFRVNPLLEEDPFLLSTTTNEDPSDTRNLLRMIGVRDANVMRDGAITLEQFLAEMASNAGAEVQELTRDVDGQSEHQAFLEGEMQAITGVDVNEELGRMLQYQRSYQAAARYIATVDEMLQELFLILR